jgi:hypothetical protein
MKQVNHISMKFFFQRNINKKKLNKNRYFHLIGFKHSFQICKIINNWKWSFPWSLGISVASKWWRWFSKNLIFYPVEVPSILWVHVVSIFYPVHSCMCSRCSFFDQSDGVLELISYTFLDVCRINSFVG